MNAINRATGSIMDVVLTPFEILGPELTLILVSGIFGILALLIFKRISWQAGIKGTKDKIKGHMIAIRLYQDDLVVVGQSVLKVLARNAQYLTLNFAPILPLMIPFVLVVSQLVVRYAFDPVPVVEVVDGQMPREKNTVEVVFKRGLAESIRDLEIEFPPGIVPASRLVRNAREGRAFQHFVATESVRGEIRLLIGGTEVGSKEIVAGDQRTRKMQPERVAGFWSSWLWPAEPTFGADSPVQSVQFHYPDRNLGFLPGGPLGILVTFFVASIVFGVLILKPLNIQI